MPKKLTDGDGDLDLMDIDSDNTDVVVDDIDNDDDALGVSTDKLSQNKNKNKSKSLSILQEDTKKGKKNNKQENKKLVKVDIENESSHSEEAEEEEDSDSKFFVVRVSGGQESLIASTLYSRLSSKKIEGIYSILFLDNFKGYVIVEALDSNIAYEALHGIRHIRGQIRGELPYKDLEGYLIKKPVVTELIIDDTVEIIAGPFKSMKAKITRVDYEKQEATVVLLDSPYQIPVTVDANYLKKTL
ncbi:MAG TPA: transcription elongation factor Spt5 [Candidatus Nitrosocosmicus sp.]|nr:transcription elongation factor Spt5 [Candidatus Nitrosocosmicus sp.]